MPLSVSRRRANDVDDYQPIDLSAPCNGELELLTGHRQPPQALSKAAWSGFAIMRSGIPGTRSRTSTARQTTVPFSSDSSLRRSAGSPSGLSRHSRHPQEDDQ